jgi:hypothetical protein
VHRQRNEMRNEILSGACPLHPQEKKLGKLTVREFFARFPDEVASRISWKFATTCAMSAARAASKRMPSDLT